MTGLSPKERSRFVALLWLVASDNDGECENAARAVRRFIQERRLDVDAVVTRGGAPGSTGLHHPGQGRAAPAPRPWQADLDLCRARVGELNDWESDFVVSVSLRRSLSDKQRTTLARIAAELRAAQG